jgi:hypothetical protein
VRLWSSSLALHRAVRCVWVAAILLAPASSAGAGTISGQVTLSGTPRSSRPIPVTKDQDYCGQTLADESYLTGAGQALKNVVVHIENPPERSLPLTEAKETLLDNNGCRFSPRVLAMRWGDRLIIRNSDPKLHIVHSYLAKRTVFNVALPFRGTKMDVTHKIKGPGRLDVHCDTHGWMRGHVHVFAHPFFAVTDETGLFSIGNLPPGKYRLKARHEKGGVRTAVIEVSQNAGARVDFAFAVEDGGANEP